MSVHDGVCWLFVNFTLRYRYCSSRQLPLFVRPVYLRLPHFMREPWTTVGLLEKLTIKNFCAFTRPC